MSLEKQPRLRKLSAKAFLIGAFEEPGAKVPMYFNRRRDNFLGYFFIFHYYSVLSVLSSFSVYPRSSAYKSFTRFCMMNSRRSGVFLPM